MTSKSFIRAHLLRFDPKQGAYAAYGIIIGVLISFALHALWQPSYKLLPLLAVIILASLAWRIKTYWPDCITAVRPFELGGALGLMFIVNLTALYGVVPLLLLVCLLPRQRSPQKGSTSHGR